MRREMIGGLWLWTALAALAFLAGCGSNAGKAEASVDSSAPAAANVPVSAIDAQDQAPPPQQTGGFDGQKAYDYTAKLVGFGPHPSGSGAIKQVQNYIYSQLHDDGCQISQDNFHAQTPIGTIPMQNIVAKVPGAGKNIILLLTHYDTKREQNFTFVGADDGGSSTGAMLELARLWCGKKRPVAIWMAFLDGEEAMVSWNQDDDHTYGSRELVATMELDGDLQNVRALILLDMIGQKGLHIQKESSSTPWLNDLIWSTADKLGYSQYFPSTSAGQISDDHDPFLAKKVPAVDLIDLNDYINEGYWHTAQDTMDKISPKSLAIVGHVTLASVNELETKFSK